MNRSSWLTLARVVWVFMAAFFIGAFFLLLPVLLTETPSLGSDTQGMTDTEFLAGLAQMGISPAGYILYVQWLDVIGRFIYLALGVFLFWRKSNDWIALMTSFIFISFLGPFEALTHFNAIWEQIGEIFALLSSVLLFLWFCVFPDGRFVPRWTRWIFLVLLATQIWRIFQPDAYQQGFVILVPIIFGGILIAQVYRFRHASTDQRQQIKWVVFGIVIGTGPLIIFGLFNSISFSSLSPLNQAIIFNVGGGFLWALFVIELPVSLTIAIFRSRLFDIDIIIRRTLQYSILTGLLGLVYFGSVVLLQRLLGQTAEERSALVLVLSTLLIAALFTPLRRRIQNLIDRRFFRKKYDAQQILAQFARTARDETDIHQLTTHLVDVVQETLQPQQITLWLKENLKSKT